MIYLDTNVIISYVDEADSNHDKATKLLGGLGEGRIVSRLTLLELTSVYSRAGLEKPLAHALYSLKLAEAKLVEIDLNEAVAQAIKYAPRLRLRTLDLLHITAAKLAGARAFATLDKEIISREDRLHELGLRIITA